MTKEEICRKLDEIDYGTWCSKIARKNGWSYFSGACKECFLIKGFPYAIKFVIPTDNEKWDEAAKETEIYQEAKKRGIERIFLYTTYFYTNKAGINFYIQEKVTESSCGLSFSKSRRIRDKTEKKISLSEVDKIRNKMYNRPNDVYWLKRAYQIYGKKFMQKFAEMTQDFGINDLHKGNTGYLNNRPVLLDFAGYHREDDEQNCYYSS